MQRPLACSFVAVVCIAGCRAPDATGTARQNALTQNALTRNALTQNALTQNALTQNALTQNALTQNALTQNALTRSALEDANARTVLGYIVSCALPAGAHLDVDVGGVTYGYDGQLGLAPAWSLDGGTCDDACQAWVSGCVIARLNHLGERVPISIRGSHDALSPSPAEQRDYPSREATYFGDIFSTPQRLYACLPPGVTSDPRVCGPSLEGCAVTFVGSCKDVCGAEREDGSYPDCRDHVRGADGRFPAGSVRYPGSITVFLP
ncbi:MAG: hypothetical protein QM820_02880 [Minicystis sp.]